MDIRIMKGELNGTVKAPASKSYLHRMIICAALCGEKTLIRGVSEISEDISATIGAVAAIGAAAEMTGDGLLIMPGAKEGCNTVDCLSSASTLRFMLPVYGALGKAIGIKCSDSLSLRPVGELRDLMAEHGCAFSDGLSISGGRLSPGQYRVSGNTSSQYLTGLLTALPLLEGNSEVVLTTGLSSGPYVDVTVKVLELFGIRTERANGRYHVRGARKFTSPGVIEVPGDWCAGGVWLCGAAMAGDVSVSGLDGNDPQGDKAVLGILRQAGAEVCSSDDGVRVSSAKLRGVSFCADDIPDSVPAVAALLSAAEGRSLITGTARLRYKESDRVKAVCSLLNGFGVSAGSGEDTIYIDGGTSVFGEASSFGDHRIAMAGVLMALKNGGIVRGAECVSKSYPSFFRDFISLGGRYEEI